MAISTADKLRRALALCFHGPMPWHTLPPRRARCTLTLNGSACFVDRWRVPSGTRLVYVRLSECVLTIPSFCHQRHLQSTSCSMLWQKACGMAPPPCRILRYASISVSVVCPTAGAWILMHVVLELLIVTSLPLLHPQMVT
jgi:hypothetical protein